MAKAQIVPKAIDDELVKAAAICAHDPAKWVRFAYEWGKGELAGVDGPRGWQQELLEVIGAHLKDETTRFKPLQIAVASGHGVGKSSFMGMLSNWALSCHAQARIVTTANTNGQLVTKTAPEIGKWARLSITAHWFDVQAQSIRIADKSLGVEWRQDFVPWSEHNTEAFAGLHNKGRLILLQFDEASKIADKVWEVAEGALTDEDTIIIWVVFGNPTRNSGRFRECFRRYRHRWVSRQIDSRDVEGTNKAKIEEWQKDHGEESDFFKIRVRGQFPNQSAMQFISAQDVERAASVHLRPEQYQFAPVIIGVDPAWTGDDTLEIMLRQGLYSKSLLSLARNDNDVEVAGIIARLEEEHKAQAVFVDAGYGTGIVSAGKAMGRGWRLVWFGGKPADPGYLNKRAEIWGLGKKWLKEGGAIDPHDKVLLEDLMAPETVARLDGRIQLEGKDAMKARGMASPNRADALMLTFAEPVFMAHDFASAAKAQVDYDIYADI